MLYVLVNVIFDQSVGVMGGLIKSSMDVVRFPAVRFSGRCTCQAIYHSLTRGPALRSYLTKASASKYSNMKAECI